MSGNTIPGDPGALGALAAGWLSAADGVETVHLRVAQNGLEGSWSGEAGGAFRSSLSTLHAEIAPIAPAFRAAGQAVTRFASELETLQLRAHRQARAIEEAEQEERLAHARTAAAKVNLDEAQLAHSLATDPISIATARSAVTTCEALFSSATARVAEIQGSLSSLTAGMQGIETEYKSAVSRCAVALGAARDATGSPLARWCDTHMPGLLGRAGIRVDGWWQSLGREGDAVHESIFGNALGGLGAIGWIEDHRIVSAVNKFDVYAVKVAHNPLTDNRFVKVGGGVAGGLFTALSVTGATGTALDYSRGETTRGRALTAYVAGGGALLTSQYTDDPYQTHLSPPTR